MIVESMARDPAGAPTVEASFYEIQEDQVVDLLLGGRAASDDLQVLGLGRRRRGRGRLLREVLVLVVLRRRLRLVVHVELLAVGLLLLVEIGRAHV